MTRRAKARLAILLGVGFAGACNPPVLSPAQANQYERLQRAADNATTTEDWYRVADQAEAMWDVRSEPAPEIALAAREFEPYLPNYYRGLAYLNLADENPENCIEARKFFSASLNAGIVQGTRFEASLNAGEAKCADRWKGELFTREPTRRSAEFPDSRALVVGIRTYAQWPPLESAVHDALEVSELLREQGFRVTVLLNGVATLDNIRRELGSLLETAPGTGQAADRAVFFFAGHGHTEPDETLGYLVPHEGTRSCDNCLDTLELRDMSGEDSSPDHVLFLLDACFSGMFTADDERAVATGPIALNPARERGTVSRLVITAGSANQPVIDDGGSGNSLFTGQLMRGLRRGIADRNGDGFVTVDELMTSLVDALAEHPQTPTIGRLPGDSEGTFFFTTQSQGPDRQ